MVVSRAGVLHAVHPVTRKTLWTFASGADMGSVIRARQGKESREINSSLDVLGDDDIGGESDEQVMYKGPDGELYIMEGSQIGVSNLHSHANVMSYDEKRFVSWCNFVVVAAVYSNEHQGFVSQLTSSYG